MSKNIDEHGFPVSFYCGVRIKGTQTADNGMFNYSLEREGEPQKVLEEGVEHWKFEGDWGHRYYDQNKVQHREDGPAVVFNGTEFRPTWFWHGRVLDCGSYEEFVEQRTIFRQHEKN